MAGSSNSSRFIPYQRNPWHGMRYRWNNSGSSRARLPSSRFRGVIPLENGKWGARISYNYKAYWLGTYQMEEEAAIAYDRASIKLMRSDSPLNFPWQSCTAEEKLFQSCYSDEAILGMIKDKKYSLNFSCFLARQSIIRKNIPRSLISAKGISYLFLFHKELTQTDVNHSRFNIPKEYAVRCFPAVGETEERNEIDLTFCDKHHGSWTFLYSNWSGVYLLTRGWTHFVTANSLKPGDILIFYGRGYGDAGPGDNSYLIDIYRYVDIVEQNGREGIAAGANILDNGASGSGGTRGEEKPKGVKIFGVMIS